ncbi:MAG: CopD family protein [Ilumatobacteraceae bacterium]
MSVRTSAASHVGALLARASVLFAVASIAVLLAPSGATAQESNTLRTITPEDGASLSESPASIVLVFNQELADDDAVTVNLSCNFEPQDIGLPEPDDDRVIVTTAINAALPKGACNIAWGLTNGEGDVVLNDTTSFAVTTEPPASSTDTTPTTGTAPGATNAPGETVTSVATGSSASESVDQGGTGGAIWLGRMLSTLGILVVFGGLALISVGWPEGPEYVVTVRFLRTAWIVSLLGTVVYLVAFAADFNGTSLGAAMSPGQWLDLKDAGWAGRGALLRLVFIGATGWVAMRPERIIDPQNAMWAWVLPGFALVAVAMSRVAGPVAPIGFIVGVAHVLSVGIWFGGAALVARVVLAGPGEDDLVQATRTFSRISIPAILVACATGIIQLIRLDGGNLFGSNHGQVLLLKTIAVAAMLAVALKVRQQVSFRLDRAHEMTAPTADRFRRAFGAEAAFGVVALAFSGWLLGLTPPGVDQFGSGSYAREITFNDPASGLQAVVKIDPARVGANGIRVEVAAPADGINNLTVQFVPPEGSDQMIIEQAIPLATAGTAVLETENGLPFRVGGTWTIRLSGSTALGTLDGATSTFVVLDADGSEITVPVAVVDSSPAQVELIDQTTTTAPFATTSTTTTVPTSTSAPAG